MFSRAAKSIVKTIGQRKYHAGEETIKVAMVGSAGEVSRSLSQMLKQSSTLDIFALHDIAASNKRYYSMPLRVDSFSNGDPSKPVNSRMLTMMEKPRFPVQDGRQNEKETDELVEALRRLPIAEKAIAADQLTKPKAISLQGEDAYSSKQRGLGVVGEMGPDKFRHGCRIVSEIYNHLPRLLTRLAKNRTKTNFRQLSSFTMLSKGESFPTSTNATTNNQSNLEKRLNNILSDPETDSSPRTNEISLTLKNNSNGKKVERRSRTKKKNMDKLSVSFEQATEHSLLEKIEDVGSCVMGKPEKRRFCENKSNALKVAVEELAAKPGKRSMNVGKPSNWTIPAALTDKKPKLLYGLVQRRQTPISWFFSKLFEVRNNDPVTDIRSCKYRGLMSDIGKFRCVQNERLFEEPNDRGFSLTKARRASILNASTSTSGLTFQYEDEKPASLSSLSCSKGIEFQISNPVERTCQEKKVLTLSSSDDSEYETTSETSEPRNRLKNISTKLALFLENFRKSRLKSRSLSSLSSYNLDSLFVSREATTTTTTTTTTTAAALFSSNGTDSKFDKLCKNFGGKKKNDTDNSCKKQQRPKNNVCKREDKASCSKKKGDTDDRKNKYDSSCGSGENDPCTLLRDEKHHGRLCKKYEANKECGGAQEEPCKKYRKKEIYGKCCGDDQGPCKKYRKEENYGKACKEYRSEFGNEDPYDKYWKNEIHGERCNKQSKGKAALCSAKKSKGCGGSNKTKSCTSEKKSSSCDREKPDRCGDAKKQKQKKKKEKKPKECGTANKKECPPVFRAPDCPKDEGNSPGTGSTTCRGYSTRVSRI